MSKNEIKDDEEKKENLKKNESGQPIEKPIYNQELSEDRGMKFMTLRLPFKEALL